MISAALFFAMQSVHGWGGKEHQDVVPAPGGKLESRLDRMISELASAQGVVYCGNGMYVDNAGAQMDEKVEAISGSWEAGCQSCGNYLEANKINGFCTGWYCEKDFFATGIWLKRDGSAAACPTEELSTEVVVQVPATIEQLESAQGVVYCGNGMYVDSAGAQMDEKVEAISGSWEAGCQSCGNYLEANNVNGFCTGWYCEKDFFATGIWLKRDASAAACPTAVKELAHVPMTVVEREAALKHEIISTLEAAQGVVYCGNGMYVDSAGAQMDEKVEAISGSWEAGCQSCGNYLEANNVNGFCTGWYCEKDFFATGIWLKRDASAAACPAAAQQYLTL